MYMIHTYCTFLHVWNMYINYKQQCTCISAPQCTYIHMYYTCTDACTCTCMYMHMYMYIHVHCMFMYNALPRDMCTCVIPPSKLCIHICTYMYTYMYICVHDAHVHIHNNVHVHVHVHVHCCVCSTYVVLYRFDQESCKQMMNLFQLLTEVL